MAFRVRGGLRSVHGPIVALAVIGGVVALVPGGVIAQIEPSRAAAPASAQFRLEEATITDIHRAITASQMTAVGLVERYLERIKAYNGVCVEQPEGILRTIRPIPNAGQINALQTLNLRPATARPAASTIAKRAA